MCIRDRDKCGRDKFEEMLFKNGFRVVIRRNFIKTTQSGPCLLYTSDAADERSSVDLGGRRIIKKKKKTILSSSGMH